MTRKEYIQNAVDALNAGTINENVFDVIVVNTGAFCDGNIKTEHDSFDSIVESIRCTQPELFKNILN